MLKNKSLRRLLSRIGKFKAHLAAVFICALISNLFTITAPTIIGKAVDSIIGKGNVHFNKLIGFIITLGVIYAVSAVFLWIYTAIANVIAYRTVEGLRKEAFDKISKLPLSYFDNNPHGDVISRITNDIDNISDGVFQGITQFYSGIVTIVGSLVLMFMLSIKITLVIIIMTPLCFLIASFITTRSNKMFKGQQKILGELNGYIEEVIGNEKVVKAFGYEEEAQKRFEDINGRLYNYGRLAQFYSSLTNPSTRFVNNVTYILVGVVGGICSVLSGLSVGKISSFLTYSTQFSQPINNVTSVATQLQAAIASAERVFAILDQETEKEENTDKLEVKEGSIKFENVSFSYRKEVPLIKNFNIDVKPGSTIAIVGPTGAGKTTMVNLLMRFYDITGGHILVDGKSVSEVTRNSLRRSFGMVLQDTWLFEGTIKENISYGKPNATMKEIEDAAKKAHIHSFIDRLPDGYDTMITEAGGNLSQGQKQLLTIARVMLIDPPMLILDEATSNVDTRTEIKIQKAFLAMMKGRTSFIIAHRLSTIRDADVILVMNNGEVVEHGNHEELLDANGFYSRLYKSQFETY